MFHTLENRDVLLYNETRGEKKMDTVRINHKNVLFIAHRGASCLETENTLAAFIAAGNRTYFGIETDVHITKDGKFILIHDDTTGRVAESDLVVEETDFNTLRTLPLKDTNGKCGRIDLRMPSLLEYIGICKKYEKTAVLELKNRIETEKIAEMVQEIQSAGYFKNVIFISFYLENLVDLKTIAPSAAAQFLTSNEIDDKMIASLMQFKLDIDAEDSLLSPALVKQLHNSGIKVNCWTCDDANSAQSLIDMGVDMITTNCLE